MEIFKRLGVIPIINLVGTATRYGGGLMLLMPERYVIKDIIDQFDAIQISSISLHEVGLEHVYLEVTC